MKKILFITMFCLAATPLQAQSLKIVSVSSQAIRCIFDKGCSVASRDSIDLIPLPISGKNFLQTRTFRGQRGSRAVGLYGYLYRIDLRDGEGILHVPCVTSLTVNFGRPVSSLDLDGDGEDGDQVFVIDQGGLGNVGVLSAQKAGSSITFNFGGVCPGGAPGDGDSTYFFGLVSSKSPISVTASIRDNNDRNYEVEARVPRAKDPLSDPIIPQTDGLRPNPAPVRRVNDVRRGVSRNARIAQVAVNRQPPIVIKSLGPQPCIDRGGTVTIDGSGFGRTQGTRVVQLGGHGIGIFLRVMSWSNTRIRAVVPDDARIDYGQWYYIGLQNKERHWISNISRTINICRGLQ